MSSKAQSRGNSKAKYQKRGASEAKGKSKERKVTEEAKKEPKNKKGADKKQPKEEVKSKVKKQAQEEAKVPKIGNDKDPLAGYEGTKPKRPGNPYSFFNTPNMKKLKEENPDMKQSEIMKKSAAEWNALTEEEKQPYEEMAKKDKERHAKQIAEIQKKGYFKMEDGQKSCDVIPKEKRKKKSPEKKLEKKKPRAKSGGKKGKKADESAEDSEAPDLKDDSTD